MNRFLTLLGLCAALTLPLRSQTAPAFPFTYYIHDTTGQVADFVLPSIYQFNATALGSSSHIVLKAVNTSQAAAFMGDAFVTSSASSLVLNQSFTVTGLAASISVPAGGSLLFQVNFSPIATGPLTAYLQTSYQVQQTGCSFTSTSAATQCPSGVNLSATLNGTATQPQLLLSYLDPTGTSKLLQPSSTPLSFGNVSTSSTAPITFALSNQSTIAVTVPSITVPAPTVYSANAFALDISKVPAVLAGGSSANFTITFEPGQTGLTATSLNIGTNVYPIQGAGVVVADIDALQISYVDNTGVRGLPQAATPISFGQITAGTSSTNSLIFTVTNPTTSYNSVAVSAVTVTGTGFAISAITGATTFPASLSPGSSLGFTVSFNPAASGTFPGTLSIGSRIFLLTGLSVNSPLPSLSLTVTPSPLSNQEQATVAVNLAAASALNVIGSIAMSFGPSVANVTSDPAVIFLINGASKGGLQLPLSVVSGAQTATSNNQSALSFQTGTTAGTLTFTVNFPNTPAFTQSFTIPPAIVQLTSATAMSANPNLVINLSGYDNTYTAGNLNFTFYDTAGNAYPAIAYNASGAFQSLFLGSTNTSGGAFALTATFPVTGDITKIGSVAISIDNSVGSASTKLTITQ